MPGNESKVEMVKVTEENVEKLLGLIAELADFEHLDPPTPEARERLRSHATSEPALFHAFLGYLDGEAVGYITYYFTYSTFLASPTLFLEDIFVRESVRRSGIGGALFRHCVKEAMDLGCGRMEWCALNWNVKAMDFYQKQGGKKLDWTFFRMDREDMRLSLERE